MKKKEHSEFARWSLKHGLLSAIIAGLGVLGFRLGIMNYQFAIVLIISGTAVGMMAILSAVISILAIYTAVDTKVTGFLWALIGLLLGLIVAAPVFMTVHSGYKLPRIHDISTDLQNPPDFTSALDLRSKKHNSLDRTKPNDLAVLQQTGYPDLKPLITDQDTEQVFEKAILLAKTRNWELIDISSEKGIIEAIATTGIMGFKDDVIIRVARKDNKTVIDMRSVSRVGISDMGTNARRIKTFLHDLDSSKNGDQHTPD